MYLYQTRQPYDSIISLGQNCQPSIQLNKHHLRTFSGVLDWMTSKSLSQVNVLLYNRFANFMLLENLEYAGTDSSGDNYMFRDRLYQIISVHDFPVTSNTPWHLADYPVFRAKLDRRIQRLLDKFAHDRDILFVRLGGTYLEAQQLEQILAQLVHHNFHVLMVQHADHPEAVDQCWPFERVCSVEGNMYDDSFWSSVLQGISVKG
jgi:hypothetical protein